VRELVVLGTASQVPTRTRNHNGYLLRWDGAGLLFDPGEGTQRQLLLAGASASSVTHICLTHAHGDHCLGVPGVIQRMGLDGVRREVPLLYPAGSAAEVRALLAATAYVPLVPVRHNPIERAGTVAIADGWTLTAQPLNHRVPTFGYRLQEPDGRRMVPDRLARYGIGGPDVGRVAREGSMRVGGTTVHLEDVSEPRRGQVFAFIMDTRWCEAALDLAAGADLVVCESTYLDADRALADEYAHLTARQAAELARSAGAGRLVLTHFSQRYGDDPEPFLREAREVFPDVVAAEDLQRVPMPPRR
jgi:ribonuclease Z